MSEAFENLFAGTKAAFSQERTFLRARTLAISSIVGLGRRTVSGMLCTSAQQFTDWSAAYRLFAHERFEHDRLFEPIKRAVLESLMPEEPLVVLMDDTLIRKRGRKVHGTGWKRDPLGPPFCTNFVWGQRFLQMSAALPDRHCPGRACAVPVRFIHAPAPQNPGEMLQRKHGKNTAKARRHGEGTLSCILHKKSGGFCRFLIDFSCLHLNLTTGPP